jgi:hypothetical protein
VRWVAFALCVAQSTAPAVLGSVASSKSNLGDATPFDSNSLSSPQPILHGWGSRSVMAGTIALLLRQPGYAAISGEPLTFYVAWAG